MEHTFRCCLIAGLFYMFGGVFITTLPYWVDLEPKDEPEIVKPEIILPDFKDGSPLCRMYSLQELCSSMKAAVACDVTPYCIHCDWSTAFNPNDAGYGKCGMCQDSLENMDATSTSGVYQRMLKSICNLHMKYEDNEVCIKTLEYFLSNQQEYWSLNPSAMSTFDTCAMIGMCYAPFAVYLPVAAEIESEATECWGAETYFDLKNTPGAKVIITGPQNGSALKRKGYRKFGPIFKEGSGNGRYSKYVCKFEDKDKFLVTIIIPMEIFGPMCLAGGFILLAFAGMIRIFMEFSGYGEPVVQNANGNVLH